VPLPAALLTPSFYIEPSKKTDWSRLAWLVAAEAVQRGKSLPVHAVVCAPREYLLDNYRSVYGSHAAVFCVDEEDPTGRYDRRQKKSAQYCGADFH
jgi:hypothetical protein